MEDRKIQSCTLPQIGVSQLSADKDKSRETLHLLRKAHQAEICGKKVSFRVRGKNVSVEEAKCHLSQKRLNTDDTSVTRLPQSPAPSVLSMKDGKDESYRE